MSERFVIWSGEHHAWWRSDSAGYTHDQAEAGRWSRDEAERLVQGAGPEKKLEIQPSTTHYWLSKAKEYLPTLTVGELGDILQQNSDIPRLKSCETAWRACFDAVRPYMRDGGSGLQQALNAIERLKAQARDDEDNYDEPTIQLPGGQWVKL